MDFTTPMVSRRQILAGVGLSAAALLAACGGGAGAQDSPSKAAARMDLSVAFVTLTAVNAPIWLAEASGAFTAHGLNVKSQYIESNVATKALIAKEIDLILQAGAPIITANLNGNAGLVMLASSLNHSQHAMVTPADIRTPADFKGKVLGADRPGTTNDYQNRVLLKLMGLQPTDVTMRVLSGGSNTLLPALTTGQIQGAALSPPEVFQAEAAGLHILQDSYSEPYQGGAWVAPRDRIDELASRIPPFLSAFHQGMVVYRQQPDLAKRTLQERTKTTDQTLLDKSYDFFLKTAPFQDDLQPTIEGIQRMLDYLADTVPAAKGANPRQFLDLRFLPVAP